MLPAAVRPRHASSCAPPIVGTWTRRLLLTPATPPQTPLTVYSILTFHRDGTLHGQSSNSMGQSGTLSTVWCGQWRRCGRRRYRVRDCNVSCLPTTTQVDSPQGDVNVLGLPTTPQSFVMDEYEIRVKHGRFEGLSRLTSYALTDRHLKCPTVIGAGPTDGVKLQLFSNR
jgi:hypothetical protein